jgi:hypothetical protein
MKKSLLIGVAVVGCLAAVNLGACGSSSGSAASTTSGPGGGTSSSSGLATGGGGSSSSSATGGSSSSSGSATGGSSSAGSGGGATTTIAAARAGNVTTPITVDAVVTGLHGTPGDYSQWYIEDPAGGPSSGVAVYCDPDLPSCPTLRAPALHTLVRITGALSTYKGSVQLVPTAQVVLQANATPPPVAMLTAADLAPTADSPYRGVVVKVEAAKLTVDSTTPPALYDTQCDIGATDAGPPLCTGCEPPTYSGFQVNDGAAHEIYIENFFFYTEHLQNSPECLTQAGVIPVSVGMTFSSMTGVLDFDPYASAQALYPMADSDYTTP